MHPELGLQKGKSVEGDMYGWKGVEGKLGEPKPQTQNYLMKEMQKKTRKGKPSLVVKIVGSPVSHSYLLLQIVAFEGQNFSSLDRLVPGNIRG